MIRVGACVTSLCLFSLSASAKPIKAKKGPTVKLEAKPEVNMRQHSLYVELFGKQGLYGIGYDYRWKPRLAVGGVASSYKIDGERTLSLSPYLSFYPVLRGHHGWFAQAGPLFVSSKARSEDPEMPSHRSTSVGAQLSSGYEYRDRILLRAFVMGVADATGVSPWAGVSLGFTF